MVVGAMMSAFLVLPFLIYQIRFPDWYHFLMELIWYRLEIVIQQQHIQLGLKYLLGASTGTQMVIWWNQLKNQHQLERESSISLFRNFSVAITTPWSSWISEYFWLIERRCFVGVIRTQRCWEENLIPEIAFCVRFNQKPLELRMLLMSLRVATTHSLSWKEKIRKTKRLHISLGD